MKLQLGEQGQEVHFLVETGASYSVLCETNGIARIEGIGDAQQSQKAAQEKLS